MTSTALFARSDAGLRRTGVVMAGIVLLLANVSKWYLDFGFRAGYHHLPLAIWVCVVGLMLASRPVAVPVSVRRLLQVRVVWLLAVSASAALVLSGSVAEHLALYAKGLVNETINTIAVLAMLLFVSDLDSGERRRLLDVYLIALGVIAAYSVAQVIGAIGFGVDLDAEVTRRLPLGSTEELSVLDERIGLIPGRAFFRLSGTTGDPSISAVILTLGLPVAYLRAREGSPLLMGAFILVLLGVIIGTMSGTAIPLALLATAASLARAAIQRRARLTALLVLGIGGAIVAAVWSSQSEIIATAIRVKTTGTVGSHAQIAGDALRVWMDHPLGLGLNGYSLYSAHFSTHNSYLQALVDLGPLGLLAMLLTVVTWIIVGLKSSTNDVGWAGLLAACILAAAAIGHDIFNRLEFQLVIAMLLGMAATGGLDPRSRSSGRSGQSTPATNPLIDESTAPSQ